MQTASDSSASSNRPDWTAGFREIIVHPALSIVSHKTARVPASGKGPPPLGTADKEKRRIWNVAFRCVFQAANRWAMADFIHSAERELRLRWKPDTARLLPLGLTGLDSRGAGRVAFGKRRL